jgi:protoporphyrinogen oxidase
MRNQTFILGAGMTGLAAGWASGLTIYEAEETPGGICSSYHLSPGTRNRLFLPPENGETYRFEKGGGHWIFGEDYTVRHLIETLVPVKYYSRRSAVFFPEKNLYVPYPLQNHLRCLGQEIGCQALEEILNAPKSEADTMADWLIQNFGPTLTKLFFGPFHKLYTAGLWTRIAPQDEYKSPVDIPSVTQGLSGNTPKVGYNANFIYPEDGLNALVLCLAQSCRMEYSKRIVQVDTRGKEIIFTDGSTVRYDLLISTLPLNKMMEMTGLELDEKPAPFTSVLALNIGAIRGPRCPDYHWIYIPHSKAGFYRVGFYSNVESSFLPNSSSKSKERVALYIERSYAGGERPTEQEIDAYSAKVVNELKEWQFIEEAEVVDPSWVEVAYTWSWPGSSWRGQALRRLEENDIIMAGRYGRWRFQGIADSIRDGLFANPALQVEMVLAKR